MPLTTAQKQALKTAINENPVWAAYPQNSDGLLDFEQAKYVRRPFDPSVVQMVGLYQALGLLTAQEAAAVLANG